MTQLNLLGIDAETTHVLIDLIPESLGVALGSMDVAFFHNRSLPDQKVIESIVNRLRDFRFVSLENSNVEIPSGALSHPFIPGIMSGKATRALLGEMGNYAGFDESMLLSCIHPSSVIAPSVTVGSGTWIHPNVTVSSQTRIGKGVTLNRNCSVGHNCSVGDFVKINPGAHIASAVQIDEAAEVGIGAVCREGIRIGKNSMIGAGSVVVKDVPDGSLVMGVPAKPFKR